MGYVVGQPVLWPAPAEWSNPVTETLAWLTDLMQASGTGRQQVRQLRGAPRRSFSFNTRDYEDDSRIVDAIAFDLGVMGFLLPIYHDVQWLTAPLAMDAVTVPCDTAGFDFVAGGQVALWQNAQAWELATVDSIAADQITLTTGTSNAWPAGTRLYPVRRARLQDAPQRAWGGVEILGMQVAVLIDEPCDWLPAWPSASTYRGVPILEWRGDESRDPTDQYTRAASSVDEDTGPIYYFDLPGMPFRVQSQLFKLHGRDELTRFRALAYALAGRAGQLWVPSWQNDLRLLQAATAAATQLQMAPCYYSVFGAQQRNRRDIRIELNDGTVFYRRITGSAQLASSETLQIDAALGIAVDPTQVRQISWLAMCQLATDTVTITHDTPGAVASAQLNWQAVKSDV